MNNFKGKMKEYPQVAIDNFESRNLDSCAFFLSHCHADHMSGLEKPAFQQKLKRSCAKLYTSVVTKCLLISDRRYKHLEPFIVTCAVGESETFVLKDDQSCHGTWVIVTALQAGHCPGSVMFFFEGDSGNVLYTGDFRLSADDWPKMDCLFAGKKVKTMDCVYMDTTFCKPSARYLPSREESRDAIFKLTDGWLAKNGRNAVYVSCAAQYGTEYVFVELSKKYNMKVHVTRSKYRSYLNIPEISSYVTSDGNDTRIHACYAEDLDGETCTKRSPLGCASTNGLLRRDEILVIRPSAMYFDRRVTLNEMVCKPCESNYFRVSYSMHSSLSEIFSAVEFLNPKEVHPIVVPDGASDQSLRSMLKEVLSASTDEIVTADADDRDLSEDVDVLNCSQNTYCTSSPEGDWDSDDIANQEDASNVKSSRRYEHRFDFSPSRSPFGSPRKPDSPPSDRFYLRAVNLRDLNGAVPELVRPRSPCDDSDVTDASPVKKKMRCGEDDDGDTTPDILF